MSIAIQPAADLLAGAREKRQRIPPLSHTYPDLSISDAYEIQDSLRAALEKKGAKMIGWKLGFTSREGQLGFGLREPAAGFLLSEIYRTGAEVSAGQFASLGAEVEVAFRMRSDLVGPGVEVDSALDAVEGAMPALELPDWIFSGKPGAADLIADSIHARAVVLGSRVIPVQELDLSLEGVVYEHNGERVGSHTAAEIMGNPLNGLAWLANHLGARGSKVHSGDIVITGSISKVLHPKAGDMVRARFTHLGTVEVRVVC
jgi:2-keto-4-pentenoate hydratase